MNDLQKLLTTSNILTKSVAWNFIGLIIPLVIAFVCIPVLIHGLGEERFGLLTIIWMSVGYFSLLDIGIGRALTKLVSEFSGRDSIESIASLIWSSLVMLLVLGVFGGVVLVLSSSYIIENLLNISVSLHNEAISAFQVIAASLPVVIVTSALIGLLESQQLFHGIAIIRIPLGVATFLGPVVALNFSNSLFIITVLLFIFRIIAAVLYFNMVCDVFKNALSAFIVDIASLRLVFNFGGWIAVINIINPILTYFDRFILSYVTNMSIVAYYTTPFEILSRIQIVPQSIAGVLFPAISMSYANDKSRAASLFADSSNIMLFIMVPIMSAAHLMAPEILGFWLGGKFVDASSSVVRWLSFGWMINVVAQPSFTLLQGVGRPDLVAKTHLAEVVPYILIVLYLTSQYGVVGAAMAWFLRVFVDTIILNELSAIVVAEVKSDVVRNRYVVLWIGFVFFISFNLDDLIYKAVYLFIIIVVSCYFLLQSIQKFIKNDMELNDVSKL